MNKLLEILEERTGLVGACRAMADQVVSGGVRARHVFAPLLAYLFVQQAVLGVVLATYYAPTATDAWASTAYIQDTVTMGWFVRGLHYHGASALVIVSSLWVVVLAFQRAYRRPWEVQWLAALGLLGVSLALGLTGNPLPWDQEGYWSIGVELSIAEQAPAGDMVKTLVQGGSDMGNLTLLRLYVLHVFVLPGAFGLLLWLVIRTLRHVGVAPPDGMSAQAAKEAAQPYFPGQAFLDVLAMTLVAGALVMLTVSTHGAELLAPADPTENFQARPAWYFLFLYKLRMFFEGPMEPVATMLIPGGAATFLIAAPLLDRLLGGRGPMLVKAGVATLMVGVVGLTAYGIQSDGADEEYQKSLVQAHRRAEEARGYAKEGVVPLGGPAVFFNDPQYQVRQLFKEHCQNCHTVDGIGGDEAPDLTDYGSRAYLAALIRNADDPRFYGNTDHKGGMSPYPETCPEPPPKEDGADDAQDEGDDEEDECVEVSAEALTATVEYLIQLSGDETMELDAALAAKGAKLWEDDLECNACHEVEKGETADGPNMLGRGSKDWIARVIRDSSQEDLFGDKAQMPKFDTTKLSDEQVETLAAFVLSQRAPKDVDDE
jgi:ubiquinol-cytochrome c reductase cytochrome b subunit